MPHVAIKLYAGKSEEEKQRIADANKHLLYKRPGYADIPE